MLPIHRSLDELEEERLGARGFGSTKRGIAPFYADKYAKLGIQVADLFHPQRLRERLEQMLAIKNVADLYGRDPLSVEEMTKQLLESFQFLSSYIKDTTTMRSMKGDPILVEGQLGALRDPDHGIYPFSTSSSTLAGYAPVGAGLPPYAISQVIAVVKAYSSCVGAGPFVTERMGMKRMSSAAVAAMQANTGQRLAGQDEWDGLIR